MDNGKKDYYTLFTLNGVDVQIIDLIDNYDANLSEDFHLSTALAYLGRNSLGNKKHDTEEEDVAKALYFIKRRVELFDTNGSPSDFNMTLAKTLFNNFKPSIGFPLFFILYRNTELFTGIPDNVLLVEMLKAFNKHSDGHLQH
jgi:hypothetical protein